MSSRISAAFGSGAATVRCFFFEKAPSEGKLATAGWYNSAAFEKKQMRQDYMLNIINGDAFSDEVKAADN